ncbi:MAG: GNAT family N-acetyltransferase [candidate division Zixibacteria bacterium]|nr:GNAT family N-acetyltransferase [candidate division Zixibacteria bacterium]
MILYQTNLKNITSTKLAGFFVGWPKPPSPETHLKILENSSHIVLAIDKNINQVIGFINAVSDKTLSAYLPLLEVLPKYQKQGIGSELVKRILYQLKDFYMIDLACDDNLIPFYNKLGMKKIRAMGIRNYDKQSGVV